MTKFMAIVEYDGTQYHGWQLQKGVPTIQGAVEGALERILTKPTRAHGSGRTDAGVHARGQVAHFSADWSGEARGLQRALNAVLPRDVGIRNLVEVPEDFHARHSALTKTYEYHILNTRQRSPLQRFYSWHTPQALDLDATLQATEIIKGTHDFASFGSPTDGTTSTVREILEARWAKDDARKTLIFAIRGTGFLRYMVRCLVGTLMWVALGKIQPDTVKTILESRNRALCAPAAPPQGLFLVRVEYEPRFAALMESDKG